jgi:formylglycine-generating enzyme required for sulfatase activity
MGSNVHNDEKPPHKVYLDAYYIDRHPVTNAEYKKFVEATGYRAPEHWKNGQIPKGKENHPVNYVSWDDANAYAKWVGKRLPTEAEWEKAARGTDKRKYPWGDEYDYNKCNNADGAVIFWGDRTSRVGKYSPHGDSPYGLWDMAGNVEEWCYDWYDNMYYAHTPSRNPTGSANGARRILRGGSASDNRDKIRTSYRNHSEPDTRREDVGFRCAKSA